MSLIKCPECGESVSDRALGCPHCGFTIAGNIIKCPECGESVPKDSVACPKCAFPLQEGKEEKKGEAVTFDLYNKEKEEQKLGPTFIEAKKLYENKSFIPAFDKINIALSVTPNNDECLKLKAAIISEIRDNSLKIATDLFKQKEYTEALTEVQSALRYAPNSHELNNLFCDIKSTKSRRRTRITTIIIIVIFAVVGSIAYGAYNSYKEAEEDKAWTEAKDSSTVSSLEHFMELYPGGNHAFEAEELLMQLRKVDSDYWEGIRLSSDVSKFEEYKTKFPQGIYLAQADNSIDSLDWVQASKMNSPEAYAGYLSSHPQGKYSSDALTAQSKITSMAPSEGDIENMKNYFSTYYSAVEDKDDNSVLDFFEPVTRQYYGIANAKKGDIMSNLKKMHGKDTRQVSIKINNDDFMLVKDESGNYNVTFSIGVSYDQEDATAESSSNMIVNAVVNQNKKIVSITSQKQ